MRDSNQQEPYWYSNCLVMSTRPRIIFDERGWCSNSTPVIGDGLQNARESMVRSGVSLATWPTINEVDLGLERLR